MGHDPTRGSGQEGLKIPQVGSGRVKRCSKCHGSGRVGSTTFQISRVGPGRIKRFSNITGRVGSGPEVFKSRGSGRVGSWPVRYGSLAGRDPMTRELFSADPRVGPADLARGSVFLQTDSCLPEGHSLDPRVLPSRSK